MRGIALTLLLTAAALPRPLSAEAQDPASDSLGGTVPELVAEGDRLHERLMPRDALLRYEAVLARDSLHYGALWKAAREAVNLGMLGDGSDRKKEWYRRAEGYARRAAAAHPDSVDGHHWLAVAVGRRALREGIRTRVGMAEEVRRAALTALALDSLHAGAHHVFGQWNAEVRRLSGFERWIASHLLGGDTLDEATWDAARTHLERAVELKPGGLIHRLELARLYLDLERPEDARRHLEEILVLPAIEPTDPQHKQEAQALLREIG